MNYEELVKALACGNDGKLPCHNNECPYWVDKWHGIGLCNVIIKDEDAAAAIEALQEEVQFYKALAEEWKSSAENKERLLGLYRAEQAKRFYSAMDDNGRITTNPCANMNIPVFSDCSENPNG